ncbi:MAG: hypothetical protein K2Y37_25710 [Pirellulales bacterium]|nr:hypothetical protein [Pirellulales bacterium]
MQPVTADDLTESFFYPACGTDFWPLMAFGDFLDAFVYSDWNIAQEQVVTELESAFSNGNDKTLRLIGHRAVEGWYGPVRAVRVNNNRRSESYGQVIPHEPGPYVPTHLFPPGFELTDEERENYLQRCETAIGAQQPWVRQFLFKRRTTGDIERDVNLVYFSDEGLARYGLTYAGSGIAPRWLCTFQSGIGWGHGWTRLEEPGATFERFLKAFPQHPDVWIRGNYASPGEPGGNWRFKLQGIGARLRENARAFTRDG